MKRSDVKIGMKVVPHDKTAKGWGKGLSNSVVWKLAQERNQPYLFIIRQDGKEDFLLNDVYRAGMNPDGDFFRAEDFEPYAGNE